MSETYSTLGESTLASGYTSGGSSLDLISGGSFPSSGVFRVRVDNEIFKVTVNSSNVLTVAGAQEGTSAANHSSGAVVTEVLTAEAIDAIRSDISGIGLLSSLPSSGMKTGDRYRPTDGFYEYVFNGTIWVAFHGTDRVVVPDNSAYSWDNQNGSSAAQSGGGIYLSNSGFTQNTLSVRYKTAPATPWSLRAKVTGLAFPGGNPSWGIGVRESGSGKIVAIEIMGTNGPLRLIIEQFTNTTAFSGNAGVDVQNFIMNPPWLRVDDDGTNRLWYVSVDGINWLLLLTEGRTTFLTADQLCFHIRSSNTGTNPVGLTLLSWEES